jgi:hypothetical protein
VFSVCCLVSRQCHNISPIIKSCDSSVLASRTLTLSPSAFMPLTRLKSLQGGAATPLAYKILCVRFTSVVHDGSSIPTKASLSARGATRDTGGWLALTRPGLAPGKKRQASLGAHHGRTASHPAAPVQIPACGTTAPGSSKLLASHITTLADTQKLWQMRGRWSLKTFISSAKPFQL